MLRVGLTGGIGSGKTTVAALFELLGVPVYYADTASKKLYDTDPELVTAIRDHFGESVFTGDVLDRKKLAAVVFHDPEKLSVLNGLVHPPTIRDAREWMTRQNTAYVIKEAALLFESGSTEGLDLIIGVSAPLSLRIKRVMERDGSTREEVLARDSRQVDADMKMKLCDFVIRNDEQAMVIPQVLALHEKLLALAEHSDQG